MEVTAFNSKDVIKGENWAILRVELIFKNCSEEHPFFIVTLKTHIYKHLNSIFLFRESFDEMIAGEFDLLDKLEDCGEDEEPEKPPNQQEMEFHASPLIPHIIRVLGDKVLTLIDTIFILFLEMCIHIWFCL